MGKPLYADKITEEQKWLGFAQVLVEIDVSSKCPKEIFICREEGDLISVGVEYPWLPHKCYVCNGFGHPALACSKKAKRVWIPKDHKHVDKRATSGVKKVVPFDMTISKPVGTPKPKASIRGLRLSNSFATIGRMGDIDNEIEEADKERVPLTFLDVFEQALSSKGKGKCKVVDDEKNSLAERGFSPPNLS